MSLHTKRVWVCHLDRAQEAFVGRRQHVTTDYFKQLERNEEKDMRHQESTVWHQTKGLLE